MVISSRVVVHFSSDPGAASILGTIQNESWRGSRFYIIPKSPAPAVLVVVGFLFHVVVFSCLFVCPCALQCGEAVGTGSAGYRRSPSCPLIHSAAGICSSAVVVGHESWANLYGPEGL